jgi:hypothetical protein
MNEIPFDTNEERAYWTRLIKTDPFLLECETSFIFNYLDEIDRINKENAALRALLDFIKDSPLFSEES